MTFRKNIQKKIRNNTRRKGRKRSGGMVNDFDTQVSGLPPLLHRPAPQLPPLLHRPAPQLPPLLHRPAPQWTPPTLPPLEPLPQLQALPELADPALTKEEEKEKAKKEAKKEKKKQQ